jgi:hypothetical protein
VLAGTPKLPDRIAPRGATTVRPAFHRLSETDERRFWERTLQLVELRTLAARAKVVRDPGDEPQHDDYEDNPVAWRSS